MLVSEHTNQNTVTVKITNTSPPLVVSSIYIEPKARMKSHLNKIEQIARDSRSNLVIAGDFNAKNVVWGGKITDRRGERLLDTVVQQGMNIENLENSEPTFYTKNGSSWIDVTLTKNTLITKWNVDTSESLSDHRYITFATNSKVEPPTLRPAYNIKQADWNLFMDHLGRYNCMIKTSNNAPNQQADELQKLATEACNIAMPNQKGTAKHVFNTWWSEELQRAKTKLRRMRRQMQSQKTTEMQNNLQVKIRKYRKIYKNEIKKAKHLSLVKALEYNNSTMDPWSIAHKIINSKGRPSTKFRSIKRNDGTWTQTEKETTEEYIKKYFPKDTENDDTEQNKRDRIQPYTWSERETINITKEELMQVIDSRPQRKAPGPDKFPNQALKPLAESIIGKWVKILNNCLKEGIFPTIWKKAEISWIPKPGSEDLRPICLLPTIGKVFDKILADRLTHYLETNGKLSAHQYGFRKTKSTIAAIGNVQEIFQQNDKKKWHTLFVAMDIQNAFNSAWYPRLRLLLAKTGCPKDLGRTIINFLDNRKIQSNGAQSCTERGAPQGSCLGPILWLIIMEDWFNEMAKIKTDEKTSLHVQAFADDQLIMISGTSAKRIELLWNQTWNACKNWAENNKVKYAPQKTVAMFTAAINKIRPPSIKMDEIKIPLSKTMKYLGIILDEKFSWIEHAKYVRGKVLGKAHRLYIVAGKTWGTDRKILQKIYEGAIKPILLYGAEIWGHKSENKCIQKHLEAAQRPFLLSISKGYRTTANKALQILTNQPPLYLEARQRRDCHTKILSGGYNRKPTPQEKLHPAIHSRREYVHRKEPGTNTKHNEVWIYSDASVRINTGIGVIIQEQLATTRKGWSVSGRRNSHRAEEKALELAIDLMIERENKEKEINFVTDSRVVLEKLCNPPYTEASTNFIAHKIEILEARNNSVRLYWTSGHKNHIEEMKAVDRLARKAATSPESYESTIIFKEQIDAKRDTKQGMMLKWTQEWTTTRTGKSVQKCIILPTAKTDLLSPKTVQLITQHGPFNVYLNRFKLKKTGPLCICGVNKDDMEHILNECTIPKRKMAREAFKEIYNEDNIRINISDGSTDEYIREVNKLTENIVFDYFR